MSVEVTQLLEGGDFVQEDVSPCVGNFIDRASTFV